MRGPRASLSVGLPITLGPDDLDALGLICQHLRDQRWSRLVATFTRFEASGANWSPEVLGLLDTLGRQLRAEAKARAELASEAPVG